MIRIILAGEGHNELGSFAIEEVYRRSIGRRGGTSASNHEPGVLETLLRHVRADGWQIVDAISWKDIPKLRVGIGRKGEAFNVQRAFHHARKRGCDVLVFARDRDGAKNEQRERDIEQTLAALDGESAPMLIGGVAIEKLESWLVAIAGVPRSEEMRRPEDKLVELGVGPKDTAAMVEFIDQHGLHRVAVDAVSLRRWLDRARAVLVQTPVTPTDDKT